MDRCVYDNMVDDPVSQPRVGCEAARAAPLEGLKNVHFTLCQKPWRCSWPAFPDDTQHLCAALHARWFELRREVEERRGLARPTEPAVPKYHAGACKQGRYIPMSLTR